MYAGQDRELAVLFVLEVLLLHLAILVLFWMSLHPSRLIRQFVAKEGMCRSDAASDIPCFGCGDEQQ